MASIAKIKLSVSKINRELVDVSKKKLTEDELAKYASDSEYFLPTGHISLLKPLHMIFWTQGASYTHTSTPQEISRIMTSAQDFGRQFTLIDKSINQFISQLKTISQVDLKGEANESIEASYQKIKDQYQLLVQTKQALIETLTEVREQTLSRPAQATKVGEEPIGNEEYLEHLFSYLKDDLLEKHKMGQLTQDMVKQSPATLLIMFIKSVDRSKEHKCPKPVVDLVEKVVHDLGGKDMIDEAFNTNSQKKYGVLKSRKAMQLQKDLSTFVKQLTLPVPQEEPLTTRLKTTIQDIKDIENQPSKPRVG